MNWKTVVPLLQFGAVSFLLYLVWVWNDGWLGPWVMMAIALIIASIPMLWRWLWNGLSARQHPSLVRLPDEPPQEARLVARIPLVVLIAAAGLFTVLSVGVSIYVLLKVPALHDIPIVVRGEIRRVDSMWFYLAHAPVVHLVMIAIMAWPVFFKWDEYKARIDQFQRQHDQREGLDIPTGVYMTFGLMLLFNVALFFDHMKRSLALLPAVG